jgi:hypothetical protein
LHIENKKQQNMKKALLFLAVALTMVTSAFAQKTAVQPEPAIKWEHKSHDFGNIKMGPPADIVFKFTNTSNAPVVIKNAQASCGCTTPSWTKTPIMPGESGEVKASYGTDGRPGYFQKSVKVEFDNGNLTDLTISGTVTTEPETKKSDIK